MYKPHRDRRSSGSYNEKRPRREGFRDRGSDKPFFKATCAECDSPCTVPFRPNGSKPVLCSNCFSGKGDAKPFGRSRGFDRGPRKPSYRDSGSSDSRGLEDQLKTINAKLDKILDALGDLELD